MKKLSKITFFVCIVLFISAFSNQQANAQTQLLNGNFENWDGGEDDEPTNWNSYPSSQCDLTGLAALGCGTVTAKRHERSNDIHPGSTGAYSCKIYSVSVLGIVANGILTTGQIRVGSTTASSSENYNISRTNNNYFNQVLTEKPDSITFWARFFAADSESKACCHAYIHDSYDFRDPMESDANNANHIVGSASIDFSEGENQWIKYSVPFDYSYTSTDAQYILITFSTNAIPSGGAANDSLLIDDVELVYNQQEEIPAVLTSISINGESIEDFDAEIFQYSKVVECGSENVVTATANETLDIEYTQATNENPVATISVTNGVSTNVYTLDFTFQTINNIEDQICVGETYSINGFNIETYEAGTITESLTLETTNELCDSIVNLTLTVNSTSVSEFSIDTIDSYTWNDQTYTISGNYEQTFSNVLGCDSIVTLHLSINTTSSDDIDNDKIEIYPNPARSFLNISCQDLQSVSIYNIAGEEIFNAININESFFNISTENFSNGNYLLNITDKNGKRTTKKISIVKE